jgi:tetratricopeptide (TPR) repeat protein
VLFRELDAHLREARDAFPDSARLALAWGMMREAQASHRILPLLMADNMAKVFATERPDPRRWLEDVERTYGRALDLDSGLHEARLRRGRVLVTLGRPDPGYADLLAVRDAASLDRRLGYLASLFAGAVLEKNGRASEAVESYRAAAELYPECQIATFALSHALREAGNRDEATRLVQVALDRGANESCLDPFWLYDLGTGPQSDQLIDDLRRRVRQ